GRTDTRNCLETGKVVAVNFRRWQCGSVVKQGKKDRQVWFGVWREDIRDGDGRTTRRQRKVRLGTVAELPNRTMARERLSVLMQQNSKSTTKLTFVELFERWKQAVVPTLKDSTADHHTYNIRSYLVPAFGTREVSEITRYDVELFLAGKAKQYCRNTIRGMRASLMKLLGWAVACDWIPKNVCAGVRLPLAGSKVKRVILTPEQVIQLAQRMKEPYSTLVLFIAVTGLRISEASGIKWSDFEGNILHIQRRVYKRRVGDTKTEGSTRAIPIPEALLQRMRVLGDGEWIFRSRAGTPVDSQNARHRSLSPAAKALGIPRLSWHDFRHTLGTHLKRHPIKVVSGILGHSDVETTLKIYQHVETEDFRGPLDEMASQLLPKV